MGIEERREGGGGGGGRRGAEGGEDFGAETVWMVVSVCFEGF